MGPIERLFLVLFGFKDTSTDPDSHTDTSIGILIDLAKVDDLHPDE